MKKLFLIFAMLAFNAQADIVAAMSNRNGGTMVLTDVDCKSGNGMVAYTQSPSVSTLFGCWWSDKIMVHITWNDGDVRSYPISAWDVDAEVAKRMKKRHNGSNV